jgi:hypothetical protein
MCGAPERLSAFVRVLFLLIPQHPWIRLEFALKILSVNYKMRLGSTTALHPWHTGNIFFIFFSFFYKKSGHHTKTALKKLENCVT